MTINNGRCAPLSPDELPQLDWSLERLGEYCRLLGRRTVCDAWRQGRALLFARALLPKQTRWLAWLRSNCSHIGQSTADRYMAVARGYELDALVGMSLTDAYRELGL